MEKVETLRQLQLVSVYIYKSLLEVCNSNGIKLYLLGGTLIGAVLHKGFVPWDDDIDVCMSKPDYMKLPPEEERIPKRKFVAEIDEKFDYLSIL